MADRSSQQIDRYRLLRLLGQGAFGDVYLAENIYRNTEVAIKILNIRLTNEDIPAFLNEARNFRLKHPHIIPIVDFGIDPASGTPFIVMDYAPHGTLRKRHPKGTQVPLATVVRYVKQIADALQYAHEEHLVHRDVKPENMLIGRQQELLLSDFGVSGIFQTGRTSLQQSSYRIGGTPYYMAPNNSEVNPRPPVINTLLLLSSMNGSPVHLPSLRATSFNWAISTTLRLLHHCMRKFQGSPQM